MNPLELQRLVDGELSHSQRAELLGNLELDSPLWRDLAMTLLEEQQWAKEIRIEQRLPCFQPSSTLGLAPNQPEAKLADRGDFGSETSGRSGLWAGILACCAMLAIGLCGGYLWSHYSTDAVRAADKTILTNSQSPTDPSNPDSRNPFENASPWRVLVESPSATPIEIPLVDARDIDPQWLVANNSLEIAKLNQKFRRKGYELDVKPTVYSGSLQDGRRFVVPVHDVSLKPYGL